MTMPIMAAHARNRCRLSNLTLALLCFVFVTPTANGDSLKWDVNDGNWKTIKLEPPKGDRDLTLDLTGLSTRLVDNVQLKLDGHTREPLYPPPASAMKAPGLKWTICGSAGVNTLEIKINWKSAGDSNTGTAVSLRTGWTDIRSNSTAVWKVRSADWQYRRLTWSGSGSAAAVGITSLDVLPAVACVAHSCPDEATLSARSPDCKTFNGTVSFKPDTESLPKYLFVKLNSNNVNGKLMKVETRRGRPAEIDGWLTTLAETRAPAGAFGPAKVALPSSPRVGASRSRPGVSGASGTPVRQRGAAVGAQPAPGGASNSVSSSADGSSQSFSLSNSGNPSVNVYNYVGTNGETGQPTVSAPQRDVAVTPDAGRAPLEERLTGEVSELEPQTLRFHAEPDRLQSGPLTFEVASNGTVYALLMVTPEAKLIRITSPNGGREHVQLCPSQLRGQWLDVTVSTSSRRPVGFSGRLYQPDTELSLDEPRQVELARNQSSVRELTFPDYETPVGLQVNAPPDTCMRASIFQKMCQALAGRLKDAVSHKYLSSGDYLPVANAFHAGRAFLRTEWAAPENCGLPAAVTSGAGGLLRAMLTLDEHEDSDVLPVVLLPPVALAIIVPAIVFWLVRSVVTKRWLRDWTSDGGGATISELPETPRLPRLVPRLLGSESGKKALPAPASGSSSGSAPGAGSGPAAMSVISEARYPDISSEKRQLAAVVSGQTPSGVSVGSYPDLSEEQRREVAAVEAEDEEEERAEQGAEKERLAAQLGVGGRPAPPSAPAAAEDAETSVSLLPEPTEPGSSAVVRRSGSDASGALLVSRSPGGLAGPLAVARHVSAPTLFGFAVAVLATSTYFSATSLKAYMAGDAGACPTSATYTVMASGLPSVGGLVSLLPTASYAACIWFLRNSWVRHASDTQLLERGIVWPAPGLEWLLVVYGAQSAVSGLCPGNNPCFTANTFVVAFVGVLAGSRMPTVRPTLPLTASVAGSALVSAGGWLPGPTLDCLAASAAAAGQILVTGYLYWQLLLPNNIGRLSAVERARLLVPREVAVLVGSQLATAALGAFVLSPGGYLALTGLATLSTTVWITKARKGTRSVATLLSAYGWLAQMVGFSSFFSAFIIGEAAYAGKLGPLEASSIGQQLYLVSCLSLALGVSPRPLQVQ
ncbi:uncharacterized protein LOC122381639 [Amphibalanus amphitrite]|uniref:uncharacterized protein LOC122381639 n=1 Tax=Amphibalanus amphitrite TaxID=1232801 RepID=UPI001C91894D|nr:uncharacterized protein LOC122381639 [Amphibalanus amphitrite]XP_043221982.1 uncharacterized protein LOC122381639 [Amphibalanus amphitrite]XP_043221983.1 uncharacterized protein LOC122381639 [Amphibalanus amphitrite]XP_043221985.1 uncharacterized protein LOC122381639 [Amphibalanus amphitrite]XP_043221986.1 uncharacterized protein LOC122381639 [Amphibalanus amphitrite]